MYKKIRVHCPVKTNKKKHNKVPEEKSLEKR